KEKIRVLAIDFDPEVIRHWRAAGYNVMYGDASDQEFIAILPLEGVKWVVSAMSQHDLGLSHEDPRLVLIASLKTQKYKGKIAVSTQQAYKIHELQSKGVDLVFLPFHDAADRAVERMKEASS
ncbi:MAG: NAD-binding protein, partial [Alphaproteobacteria bacterium]|nr:NAD-binding protein [Alphaproteobacteria bacterium]